MSARASMIAAAVQQAETASCKKSGAAATSNSMLLSRSEFTTSRLAEFASIEELTKQIGHGPEDWPVATLKELVDNGLDAAERAGVAPVISIVVDESSISVADNGVGIPDETIEQILDFAFKTSSNAVYRSPTRGQQGNAFQCLLAMAHSLSGEPGVTSIESRGVRHRITFDIDPISREPRLDHQRVGIPAAPGTKVTLFWPAPLDEAQAGLQNTAFDFACFNPHVRLSFASERFPFKREATNPGWAKWTPTAPIPAHWYDLASLKNLIAAEIGKARKSGAAQRTVADFVVNFAASPAPPNDATSVRRSTPRANLSKPCSPEATEPSSGCSTK